MWISAVEVCWRLCFIVWILIRSFWFDISSFTVNILPGSVITVISKADTTVRLYNFGTIFSFFVGCARRFERYSKLDSNELQQCACIYHWKWLLRPWAAGWRWPRSLLWSMPWITPCFKNDFLFHRLQCKIQWWKNMEIHQW